MRSERRADWAGWRRRAHPAEVVVVTFNYRLGAGGFYQARAPAHAGDARASTAPAAPRSPQPCGVHIVSVADGVRSPHPCR
eukprot:SAG11_NODE_7851_length_1088_cov_1.146613_2_plen_81_part_00